MSDTARRDRGLSGRITDRLDSTRAIGSPPPPARLCIANPCERQPVAEMVTALLLRRLDARVDMLEERLEAARKEQLLAAEQTRGELVQMKALLTRLVDREQ